MLLKMKRVQGGCYLKFMISLFFFVIFSLSDLSEFKERNKSKNAGFSSSENRIIIVLLSITIIVVLISLSICLYVWFSTKNSNQQETQQRFIGPGNTRFARQENQLLPPNFAAFSPFPYNVQQAPQMYQQNSPMIQPSPFPINSPQHVQNGQFIQQNPQTIPTQQNWQFQYIPQPYPQQKTVDNGQYSDSEEEDS